MPNFTILGVSQSPLFLEMAKIWPFYGQIMVLMWSFTLFFPESYSMCPGMLHAKFHYSGCIPLYPFPRFGQNMALLWPQDVPHMVLQICSSWILINVPREAPCKISQFWVYPIVPFSQKWPKYGPFMAKTWSSHGPSYWFFLNHNQCAQGCSMPNFTILGVSHSPLFLEMAKIWPFCGQNMVLTWSFKLVLPGS